MLIVVCEKKYNNNVKVKFGNLGKSITHGCSEDIKFLLPNLLTQTVWSDWQHS